MAKIKTDQSEKANPVIQQADDDIISKLNKPLKLWHGILAVLLMIWLAFNHETSPDYSDNAERDSRINDLTSLIDSNKSDLSLLKEEVDYYNLKWANLPPFYAEFKIDSDTYSQVMTRHGIFYISLSNVAKYANGYKLTFQIGNPYSHTFMDAKVKLQYGINYLNKKEKEHSILTPIHSGRWNSFTVIISPATEEDLNYISVMPVFDSISFR